MESPVSFLILCLIVLLNGLVPVVLMLKGFGSFFVMEVLFVSGLNNSEVVRKCPCPIFAVPFGVCDGIFPESSKISSIFPPVER